MRSKWMVKNGYLLVWLALLASGITAAPARAQIFASEAQTYLNENFLLTAADSAGNDLASANHSGLVAKLQPDDCKFTPVSSIPLSLEPTATDQHSDRALGCFGQTPRTSPLRFSLAPVSPCAGAPRIDFASACVAQP